MRRTFVFSLMAAAVAASVSAQTAPATLRLSVDDAVEMALEHNVDLKADRFDPQISDTRIAAAAGAFRPTFSTSVQQQNQLQPPTNFLIPTPTQNDAMTSTAGLAQRLPWFGTA